MRHFRNLLWFFVGILLVSIPMYSYAINLQLGKYYQVDSNVVRNMSDIARPISTNNFTTAMADSWKVNLTSDLTATMEKGLIKVPLTDTIAADVGVFTGLGRQASRCLATNVAAAYCLAGAAATAFVADVLVEKGYQWMDDAKCQVTAGCSSSGWNQKTAAKTSIPPTGGQYRINGQDFGSLTSAIKDGTDCGKASDCKYTTQWIPQYSAYLVGLTFTINGNFYSLNTYVGFWSSGSCSAGYNFDQSTATCVPTSTAPSYAPTTQEQIDTAVDDAIKNKISPFVDAVRKDGTILTLDDSTKSTTSATPTTAPAVPTQTTTQNPDGSTTTETKQTQKTYKPSGSGSAADPITITTTTTETTNSCTGAGSCSTTNKTTTETPADTKTQCDLYPGSLACAGLGTPPDGDIPSQTVNTDYQQDGRISFSHTCPAPQQYTVHGVVYYSDWTLLCQYSTKIKPLIIGAAAFLAALIIAYGHKS